MPYNINRYKDGYRVCKNDGICFSKQGLPLDVAKKQRIALYLSEHKKHGGALWRYDPALFNEIKDRVVTTEPIHSLERQAKIHSIYHDILSGGHLESDFVKQLDGVGMTSTDYLYEAKLRANRAGYNSNLLSFANDGKHKLQYDSPNGIKKFGAVRYNDFIIWKHLELKGKVPKGYAEEKRKIYHDSHERISQIHKLDKFSPNALSLVINW